MCKEMCLVRFQPSRRGHLLPHEPIAIVKPILKDRAYRKASMPDYQNIKKIEAILSM